MTQNRVVTSATYAGNLSLEIHFSDNTVQIVNVGDYIRSHPHPQYNKYLSEKYFKRFTLENGNVVWGHNWDLIFPIDQLYKGVLA